MAGASWSWTPRGGCTPFGIWRRQPSTRMRFLVKLYCAALIVIFLAASAAAMNLDDRILSFYRGCYFPPCYTAE